MGGFKGMKTERLAITLNQRNFFLFFCKMYFLILDEYPKFEKSNFLLRVQMKIIFTFCFHDALSHFLETCSNVLHLWASTSIQKRKAISECVKIEH